MSVLTVSIMIPDQYSLSIEPSVTRRYLSQRDKFQSKRAIACLDPRLVQYPGTIQHQVRTLLDRIGKGHRPIFNRELQIRSPG